MKTNRIKPIVLIGCLIAVTCLAMAEVKNTGSVVIQLEPPAVTGKSGIVTLTGSLVQDKIVTGGDGRVSLALTMTADDILDRRAGSDSGESNPVDMVIVLDQSGSMSGKKISDAKNAALALVSRLSARDRFALVTYSNTASSLSGLVHVSPSTKNRLQTLIAGIYAGGGTNLGHGLQTGIDILTAAAKTGNTGRLILISDGLANKGITDINALGKMASVAAGNEFSISTAGLGTDFNEELMTSIADYGTGNYYFMENPSAFAAVFNQEFEETRTAAATSVKISFPETNGIYLADAGGYPLERKNGMAVFYPGDLMSGETRTLFLSLQVPSNEAATFDISGISLSYNHDGTSCRVALPKPIALACVEDPRAAMASIDKGIWEQKVLKEDFSRLKEAVAGDIRGGRREEAAKKIDQYYSDQQAVNAEVASEVVAGNLEKDLDALRQTVDETFSGPAPAIAEKREKNAKVLQYEGYQMRR